MMMTAVTFSKALFKDHLTLFGHN